MSEAQRADLGVRTQRAQLCGSAAAERKAGREHRDAAARGAVRAGRPRVRGAWHTQRRRDALRPRRGRADWGADSPRWVLFSTPNTEGVHTDGCLNVLWPA